MVTLPLDPGAELNNEPNPFEKSFSTSTITKDASSPASAPASTTTNTLGPNETAQTHYKWNSTLGNAFLTSSSTAPPTAYPACIVSRSALMIDSQQEQASTVNAVYATGRDNGPVDSSEKRTSLETRRKGSKKPRTAEEDEKRRNFLERNRLAALKCRQRKKQWLNNLQSEVELLSTDNEQLQLQVNTLREEVVNLKTLLLAHKDCLDARHQAANFDASSILTSRAISIMMQPATVSPASISILHPHYSAPSLTSSAPNTSSILPHPTHPSH